MLCLQNALTNSPVSPLDQLQPQTIATIVVCLVLSAILVFWLLEIRRRRGIEAALRESEARHRALFDNNHSVMLLIDPADGQIVDANPAASRYYGWTVAELRAKRIHQINTLPPAQVQGEMAATDAQLRNHFTFTHRLASGELRPVEVYSGPLEVDGRPLLLSIVHDAADRQRAEEEHSRLAAIVEGAADAIFSETPDGLITSWNKGAERLYGYRAEEIVGRSASLLMPPECEDEVQRILVRIRRGERVDRLETVRRHKDGRRIQVSLIVSPIEAATGRPAGAATIAHDVTARRQMEADLRESEERFRLVLKSAPVTVAAQDRDLRFLWAYNQRTADPGTVIGKADTDLFPPEDAQRLMALKRRAMEQDADVRESLWVSSGGQRLFLDLCLTPLRDAAGRVTGVGVATIDLTPMKVAEAALLESEARFRAVFEQAGVGVALTNSHTGQYLRINQKHCDILGYSLEEMASLSFQAITYPDDLEPDLEAMRRLLAGEIRTYSMEKRFVRKDGRLVWGNVTVSPLWLEGERPGYHIAVVEDITERKRAEEALRESETRFRSLFSGMTEGVALHEVIYDGEGRAINYRILEVNARYETILHLGRQAVVGRLATEAYGTPEAPYLAEYRRVVETGEPCQFETYFPPMKLHFTISVARLGPGRFATIFFDITERVRREQERQQAERTIRTQRDQLEAQNHELFTQNEELMAQGRALAEAELNLQAANSGLEERIESRTAELRAANAALLRAGRLKDEFLANMSHELRTPLTGILGLAEVMEKGIYGALNARQSQALQMIQGSGAHLLELINDVLDLSKLEAGKMELQLEPLEVEGFCRTSLEFIQQAARKKNIRCSYRHDRRITQLRADSRRLTQMLVNLLSNAVKFTPEGGHVGLEVEGDPDGSEVRFSVWDTGIGIPLEQQRYLFQPFVQLDGSLARQYEGTGLGLALVHSLAELHGGRVAVESAGRGQGARFTLTLPWRPETASEAPAKGPETVIAGQGVASLAKSLGRPPVILAVDDSPVALMVVSNFLEAADCRVVTAPDGAQALQLAGSVQPDLMLLDIQMPHLDGLTLIRQMRADPALRTTPIIAVTALAMPGDRDRCLDAGANEYLSKPVDLDELTRAIARLLESKKPGGPDMAK